MESLLNALQQSSFYSSFRSHVDTIFGSNSSSSSLLSSMGPHMVGFLLLIVSCLLIHAWPSTAFATTSSSSSSRSTRKVLSKSLSSSKSDDSTRSAAGIAATDQTSSDPSSTATSRPDDNNSNNHNDDDHNDRSCTDSKPKSAYWGDLVTPSFLAQDEALLQESFSDLYDHGPDSDIGSSASDSDESCASGNHDTNTSMATHFCFLVHGHRGVARDLWYMQMTMQRHACIQRRKQKQARKIYYKSNSDASAAAASSSVLEKSSSADEASVTSLTNDIGVNAGIDIDVDDIDPNSSDAANDNDTLRANPFQPTVSTPVDLELSPPAQDADHINAESIDIDEPVTIQHPLHDMVVHSSVCNEGKTTDGIEGGGDRLVEEMLQVIHREMNKRVMTPAQGPDTATTTSSRDITISVVGNSLGGLYGRYAIAKFIERHCERKKVHTADRGAEQLVLKDTSYHIHLNIFCTTATPHLGISRHTFIPLPRSAEITVAHVMGETGRDLFRINDLLQTMSTSSDYLTPLKNFRQRIAYANAYGTDFPVPTSTAAFLSEDSTYPHYFTESKEVPETDESMGQQQQQQQQPPQAGGGADSDPNEEDPANHYIIATLRTPKQSDLQNDPTHSGETAVSSAASSSATTSNDGMDTKDGEENERSESDELQHMSECLDRLGWKKIFLDMRKELPSMGIPKSAVRVIRRHKHHHSTGEKSIRPVDENGVPDNSSDSDGEDDETEELDMFRKNGMAQSRDLANTISFQKNHSRLYFPGGHNMMVAFSRTRLSSFLHKGGRPVVDSLAKNLVRDIFQWSASVDAEMEEDESYK